MGEILSEITQENSTSKINLIKVNLKSNWRTSMSLGVLVLLPLVFLWRVTFGGDILLSTDMLLLYEPWRSELPGAKAFPIWNEKTADPLRDIYSVALYIKETWRQGQIPFWYPYAGLGLPILARAMNQVLYPINNILWQLMAVPESFGWSAVLHLFLASCFTFFYVRELQVGHFGSLIAAIAFTYSSTLMTWLGLPFIFNSMIWLPLIFLGLERAIVRQDWRWGLLGVLGLALQILAGSLQLVSYGLTALGLYALIRFVMLWRGQRHLLQALYPLGYAGLIIGMGFGLVAFQVLSTVEMVLAGITRANVALDLGLPIRTLARLLIPDIIGTPLDGNNLSSLEFESYLYFGILPLFFVIASLFSERAVLARILFGIGLLFLLVIYNVPPFYQIFYNIYPAFSALGFHRSLYVVIFVWTSAAGVGADYILTHSSEKLLRRLLAGGLLIGLIALAITLRLAFISKYQERHFWNLPDLPAVSPGLLYHFSTLVLFLFLFGLMLGLLWLWLERKVSPQFFMSAAVFLLVLDLFLTHIDFTPALPRHMLNVSPPSLTFLQELVEQSPEPIRISGIGNALRSDTGGAYKIPSLQVHDSYLSRRFSDYADLTKLRSGDNFRDIIFQPALNPLLNALNVKYIYTAREDLTHGEWFSVLQNMGAPQIISNHPEAGQVKHWNIKDWTQPVLYAPSNTSLIYQSVPPYPALLETAIAIDPQTTPQADITFEIYVNRPGQEPGAPIFSYRLEPFGKDSEPKWRPIVVDLADFGQENIIISLVTSSDNNLSLAGGWADPLITDSSKYKQVYYGVNSIYENKNYLPKAWVAPEVTQVVDAAEAKARISAADFNPATEAVIEGALIEPVDSLSTNNIEKPEFIQYSPSHSKIEVKLETSGFLVLSELYYPGWQVYVDGVQKPLYATNLTMRGVFVPAGTHQVEFVYEPLVFRIGLYIAVGTAAIIAVILALGRLRNKETKRIR